MSYELFRMSEKKNNYPCPFIYPWYLFVPRINEGTQILNKLLKLTMSIYQLTIY